MAIRMVAYRRPEVLPPFKFLAKAFRPNKTTPEAPNPIYILHNSGLATFARVVVRRHTTWRVSCAQLEFSLNTSPEVWENAKMQARFDQLAAQWLEDTEWFSSSSEIIQHPAYHEIISMGMPALPWIMRSLEETGGHWFWALRAITGEDPVPIDELGDVAAMTARWLAWWNTRNSPRPRKRINARSKTA